jgi:type I restriction enzyme S subunit
MNIEQLKYNLPNNWAVTQIKEIVTYSKGRKPYILKREKFSNSIPYLDIRALEKEITEYANSDTSFIVNEGDLVMVWDGSRSGLVLQSKQHGTLGSTLVKINTFSLNTSFLYYFLLSKFEHINNNLKGTGIPHVNPQILGSMKFPLPPSKEQYRIVEKIEELFSEIEHTERNLTDINKRLEVYWQSVLDNAFNNITGTIKHLISLTTFIGAGSTPKGGRNIYGNSGIPFIRSQNVLHNSLNLDNVVYITDEINEKMSRTKIQTNDVLLNITGASIGRCAYIPENVNQGNVNQHVCIIRTLPDLFHKYLTLYLNSPKIQRMIQELSSGATREALTLS